MDNCDFKTAFTVLIETLWNVKYSGCGCNGSCNCCINRNIMECKAVLAIPDRKMVSRINRNIMECKEKATKAAKGYLSPY